MRPALYPPSLNSPPSLNQLRASGNRLRRPGIELCIDALLENGRWLEHHDPPRRDRHFLTGLRIAADPFALLAHHEGTEGRELHRLAALKAVGDLLQHHFDE